MAYALNNVTSPAAFSDSVCVLRAPNVKQITCQISNAAVYYQFACRRAGVSTQVGAEQWEPYEGGFLLPGQWVFNMDDTDGAPFVGIRFRSAVTASPAQVTALA